MKFSDATATGMRHIQENRLRAGLSILGILIGIASVLCMMAIGDGAKLLVADQVDKLGGANQFFLRGADVLIITLNIIGAGLVLSEAVLRHALRGAATVTFTAWILVVTPQALWIPVQGSAATSDQPTQPQDVPWGLHQNSPLT